MSKIERPEALAQFAEAARRGEREGVAGLLATKSTAPIPTDPKAKDDAATRVLAEGATGEDRQAEAAVDQLPDRILASQGKSGSDPEADADSSLSQVEAPYDASRDPRTGRPPQPLEAQRIARDNEMARLSRGTEDTGDNAVEDHEDDTEVAPGNDDASSAESLPVDQKPARMAAPEFNSDERAAILDLVDHGVARERAEELVRSHGTDGQTLRAATWVEEKSEVEGHDADANRSQDH